MDPESGIERANARTEIPPRTMVAHDILRRLARLKNHEVAKAMGRDPSLVSRIASEELGVKLSDLHPFLLALGLKLVDANKVCVDRSVYESYKTLAVTALTEPAKLHWEDGIE